MRNLQFLAMSGSLRKGSTNSALVNAARLLAPSNIEIIVWNSQAELPHFTPDLEAKPPEEVIAFRNLAAKADGIIIACPEYARGIPGSFKNALDWLVGSETFFSKKFTLWNGSPRASEAQKSLRLVLETMSGVYVDQASLSVPLINKLVSGESIAATPELAAEIERAMQGFVDAFDMVKDFAPRVRQL